MDLPHIPPNPDISAEQLRKALSQAAKQEGSEAGKQLLKLISQATGSSTGSSAKASSSAASAAGAGSASTAAGQGAAALVSGGATLGELDIPPQLKANLLQVLSRLSDQSLLDEFSRIDTKAAKRAITLGSSQDILKLEQALRQSIERQLSQNQPLKNLDSAIDTLKQQGASNPPSPQQVSRVLNALLNTPANQLQRQIATLSVPLRQGVLDALLSREARALLPNTQPSTQSAGPSVTSNTPVANTGLAQATRGVTTPQNLAAVTQSYQAARSPAANAANVSLSAALTQSTSASATSPFQIASLAQALSQQGTSLVSLSSPGQAGLLSVVTGQASQAPAQGLLQQLPAQQLPLLLATPAALSASPAQSQALVDQLVVRLLQPSSSLLSASTPLNASSLSGLSTFGSQPSIAPIQSGALDQLVVQLQQADSILNGINSAGATTADIPILSDGLQQALRPALQVNTSAELTRLWELLHSAAQRLSQESNIESRLRALLRYVSTNLPESARQALTEGLNARDSEIARLVQQIAQASSASQASALAGATPRQGVDALLSQLLGAERHLLQQQTQLGGLRDAIHTLHGINDQALLLKAQTLLQANPQFDAEFLLFYQGLVQRVAVQIDPDGQQGKDGDKTGQYMRFHFNFTRMGPISANIHYREPSVTIVLRHQTPQAGATLDKHLEELKEKLNQFDVQVTLRVVHDPDMQLPDGPFHSVDTQA